MTQLYESLNISISKELKQKLEKIAVLKKTEVNSLIIKDLESYVKTIEEDLKNIGFKL
ncbi:MAG: hypothetical protein ACFFKA_18610 [Candidatus Thorarchaeota archaeon]